MNPFFIWAHRGASAVAPENTLAAFQLAEAAGADGIELDIQLTRDGVPVVLHDLTLERTTTGRGEVARCSWRALQRLDAGSWFAPAFAGEAIPRLDQVLAWAQDRLRLNLEIKDSAAAAAVLDTLRDFPQANVLVSSFDHPLLERLRGDAPKLPLGFLLETHLWRRGVQRAAECGAQSLHPRCDLVSRPLLAACRQRALAVFAWTVDDRRRLHSLRRLGVDGVFTNHPAASRQLLGRSRSGEASI
ncbi:MAG: glycerophosphodiester phosphodiesterase [Desulfuromonadales bacterium]|nr:glycerophosphodiester phosphodiesterase [Desulfuromonadales bacterium]